MDDALLVGGAQALGELGCPVEDLGEVEPLLRDQSVQRLAFHQLHGEEVAVALLLDGEQGHHIGVAERRNGARFALETLEPVGVPSHCRWQDLEGHLPPELRILGLVHRAHAALADDTEDPVAPEGGAEERVVSPIRGRRGGGRGLRLRFPVLALPVVLDQQRLDLATQLGVVAAGLGEVVGALLRPPAADCHKQLLHPTPPLGVHQRSTS